MLHELLGHARGAAAALLLGTTLGQVAAGNELPAWVFPACPATAPGPDPRRVESLPGSSRHYRRAEITQRLDAIDWFPQRSGSVPSVVLSARGPGQPACGYCHLPDGTGRPENAKLAGLPQSYIVNQVAQIHSSERLSALAGYPPSSLMRSSVEGLTGDEIQAAADYFARQRPRSFERVLESDTVPAFTVKCFILAAAQGDPEPLGERIMELADHFEPFELRDPRSTFTAYVPRGSLKEGANLVTRGRDALAPCSSCHGTALHGGRGLTGPPLAGRFAGYLARQLYGFKSGTRHAAAALSMQTVVATMSDREILAVTAYAASLKP